LQDDVEKKHSLDCYIARFIPNISRFHNNPCREHCLVNRDQLNKIGGNLRRQIRIERPTANGTTLALYTVIDVHDQEPDTVFVGYKNPEDLRDRLELSRTDAFTGRVNTKVAAVDLSYAEAESNSEFIEDVNDDGYNREVVVIAPHGGHIEKYTDKQAERVGKQLSSKYVSEWICRGFKQGGGAFDRWHITSTDINEDSFPKLKTIIGRQFEYSVAFHGWDHDSICIGGLMPPDMKLQFKTAIMNAVSGSDIVVTKDDDVEGTCTGNFNGSHPKNIVNRLSAKGLHIEQSSKARTRFGIQIADAVAGVLDCLIRL
jgi:phage replication-related protein YjqB (UPF0714/DUF867 family)